jgi:hypothetical protein
MSDAGEHCTPLTWSANAPIPVIVERIGHERIVCRAVLDPNQPYLDHHRADGLPLLGTVMGIETMARAAKLLLPEGVLSCINDHHNGPPIILTGHETTATDIRIDARIEQSDANGAEAFCEVRSYAAASSSDPTFSGCFHMSKILADPPGNDRPARLEANMRVSKDDIYRLFFHGPWFQVISGAFQNVDAMTAFYAVTAQGSPAGNGYEAVPREIEFCLQTAGLFELAQTGRLMVPFTIEYIRRWRPALEPATSSMTATARRSVTSGGNTDLIDIDLFDAQGRLRLRVMGYGTVLLPFPSEQEPSLRLQELLRGTSY